MPHLFYGTCTIQAVYFGKQINGSSLFHKYITYRYYYRSETEAIDFFARRSAIIRQSFDEICGKLRSIETIYFSIALIGRFEQFWF